MRAFLQKFVLFLLFGALIMTASFGVTDMLINKPDNFIINPKYTTLIIGHSHPECSMNDSIIRHSLNLAQSGESYFYSFIKLKKLLESNPNIKRVLVEFTNNCITQEMDTWTYANKYLLYRYPKYSAMMNWDANAELFLHNPKGVINAQSLAIKTKLKYLLTHQDNFVKEADWGKYEGLNHTLTSEDSLKATASYDSMTVTGISEVNLRFLKKITELCKHQNVDIILIRSPQNPSYPLYQNEAVFLDILNKRLPGIKFLDYHNLPIPPDEFADLEHLNAKGSARFSMALDSVLNSN